MAQSFQPPPTYAEVVILGKGNTEEERIKNTKFNPIWLKWFLDVAQVLGGAGGGGGTLVHNDLSGLQGGTANQFFHLTSAAHGLLAAVAATTFTPGLTNVTNVAASTAYQGQYIRIGNIVVASGKVDIDPTAAGQVVLGIALPVASNIGAQEDCAGAAVSPAVAGLSAAILGDATNNRAQLEYIAVDIANRSFYYIYLYEVI
jgi:hypothetical protein